MRSELFFISIISSITVTTSCGTDVEEDASTKKMIMRMAEKVQADSSAVYFSLGSLTEYTWDKVFILSPYSQLEKLGRSTNVDLSPIEKTEIEFNDSKTVIAFITNGKVISYVDLQRKRGDFSYLNDSLSDGIFTCSFRDAKFRMVNKKGWPVVEKTKN